MYQTAPYSLNPTEAISMSKREFNAFVEDVRVEGVREPIAYVEFNGEKYVVDGHHRLMAAKLLNLQSIPVVKVDLPYKGYRHTTDLFGYVGP